MRGGAIYPACSLVNHECAPNAARFDCIAAPGSGAAANTVMQMRAMHDLPVGAEVTISYMPLNWDLEERQEHLQEVGGSVDGCPAAACHAAPGPLDPALASSCETPHLHGADRRSDPGCGLLRVVSRSCGS